MYFCNLSYPRMRTFEEYQEDIRKNCGAMDPLQKLEQAKLMLMQGKSQFQNLIDTDPEQRGKAFWANDQLKQI